MARFLHKNSIAYAVTTLGAGTMNGVFFFYYVKVYLHRFHVSESWFHTSQILYMIWNAVNDPLFGYIQDNYTWSWVKSRRHSILYGAPFYALAFVLPWFPWDPTGQYPWISGVQLTVVLCLYDTLLTFVLLAQCALFTEMSTKQEDRLRLVRYSQIASLLGAWPVFVCESVSHNLDNFGNFQIVCVLLAVFGCGCMIYTGLNAQTTYDTSVDSSDKSLLTTSKRSAALALADANPQSGWQQGFQIISQRSFVAFILTNFVTILHTTFYHNFVAIFCDQLISRDTLGTGGRSFFYGILQFISQIMVICGAGVVATYGYYRILRMAFLINIVAGFALYTIGPANWHYLLLHLFLVIGVNHASFSLFNLPLSDIIDADKERHNRRLPLSSMVFGTNALFTKPANSFAPMIIVALLNQHGYQAITQASHTNITTKLPGPIINAEQDLSDLHGTMFTILCVVPVLIGCLQTLFWSFFPIQNSHLSKSNHVNDSG